MTVQDFWDMRSERYDEQVGTHYAAAYRETEARILRRLAPSDRVLDFACGTGIVTLPVARCVKEVRAIDLSGEMVRITREKAAAEGLANLTVTQTDLFDPTLREGSFDAVLACNVLLYLEDRAAALARIRALLREGGEFLSATDCLGDGFTRERVRKWWRSHTGKMPHVSFDRKGKLPAEIAAAGFEVLETGVLYPAPPNLFVAARRL